MRKRILFVLIYSLAVIFTFTCNQKVYAASGSPNNISVQTQPPQPVVQKTQAAGSQNVDPLQLVKEQLRGDYYKESLDNHKWALGIIVGLVVAFVGYTGWRNDKAYKEAVSDANKALDRMQILSDKAEGHCEKAKEYERQAQEKLASIDDLVKTKRKELDEQAGENRAEIEKIVTEKLKEIGIEAERQRKVSELWNKALRFSKEENHQSSADCFSQIVNEFHEKTAEAYNNWAVEICQVAEKKEGLERERILTEACKIYQKAIDINPNLSESYNNFGHALGELGCLQEGEISENLYLQSFDEFQKATNLKPDYYDAYNNWGIALGQLAKQKTDNEAEILFNKAFNKFKQAIDIKSDYHYAYNNWGLSLGELAKQKRGEEAENLFNKSFEKLQKAINLKADYYDAFSNLGCIYLYWSRIKKGQEKESILKVAEEVLLKAESIKVGSGSYNLACLYGIKKDKENCRKWLETAQKEGKLVELKQAMKDEDLKIAWDEEWFKQLRFKGE